MSSMSPVRMLCLLLLCFGFYFSHTSAIRVQTIAEAKEQLQLRQKRAADPSPDSDASIGSGIIFGNDSFLLTVPNCFLLETKGVGITVQEITKAVKSLDAVLTSNTTKMSVTGLSNCPYVSGGNDSATAEIEIKFDTVPTDVNVTDASIRMTFTQDRFNWYLTNLTLSVKLTGAVTTNNTLEDVSLNTKELFASRGTSYYCNNQLPFRTTHGTAQISLYFYDLIIEPFVNDTSLGFSPVESCEYAFSIGIWMGVLTALIMAVILGFGISMLASIRNMDRFDDPKTSKLLSVPNE